MKKPPEQRQMFSAYSGMTLLDMWAEIGRIRRKIYAMQMAEESRRERKEARANDSH